VAKVRLDWCLDECISDGDRMDCCHDNQAACSYSYSDIDDDDEEGSNSYASDSAVAGDGYSSSEEDDDDHDEEGFSNDDTRSEVTEKCVLLGGLSEATYLTLLSSHTMYASSISLSLLVSIVHYTITYVYVFLYILVNYSLL